MEWDDIFGPNAERYVRPRSTPALETLQTAAETEPPVSLLAAHMTLSCPGYLRAADDTGVLVDLPRAPATSLEEGATTAIRFPFAGKSAGFTTRVLELAETRDGGLRLRLELPEVVRTDEQRTAVRIPISDGMLAAALVEEEKPIRVRPLDISLSGMAIELEEDTPLEIALGHRRLIALKLGSLKVLLEVEVRRQDGARFGVAFILRDERPPALVKMVTKLQYHSTAV